MFKYFIWDYDGTLFDTYPAITSTCQEMLKKEYGIDKSRLLPDQRKHAN